MKKMKQFDEANLELVLFGSDVIVTSEYGDNSENKNLNETYAPFNL